MHVSPLMGMDQTYEFRASEPADDLQVHIESHPTPEHARTRSGGRASRSFDATLSMQRSELSRATLAKLLARYPAMSLQVVARIYAQTVRMKLKGARYFPHPEGRRPRGFLSP